MDTLYIRKLKCNSSTNIRQKLFSDIKTSYMTRDKEGHFIMINGSIHQEYIKILYLYVTNNKASKYMELKSTKVKGQTHTQSYR